MNNPTLSKNFIFNEKIDANYLFSLYADDYPYIEEVFSITLQHFDHDQEAIAMAWSMTDLGDLKKAIHKIKPAFGFVGLTDVQQQCKEFEDLCQEAAGPDELKISYKQIVATLAESKSLMESELRRLKEFNSSPI